MYWSPNFLAVVFKKQGISQQIVRMHDLASVSKNFPGMIPPDAHSGRVRGYHPQLPARSLAGRGHKCPGVGTQTFVPLNFSAVIALRPCELGF